MVDPRCRAGPWVGAPSRRPHAPGWHQRRRGRQPAESARTAHPV